MLDVRTASKGIDTLQADGCIESGEIESASLTRFSFLDEEIIEV